MGLFRRKASAAASDPTKALYVHLADDGAIFVLWGATGEQAWIGAPELHEELAKLRESGGRLIYTRDAGDRDPPEHVTKTFDAILEYKLPIQLLEEPHPQALVPPDQRRTIRRPSA
jgi:hypothetical protein